MLFGVDGWWAVGYLCGEGGIVAFNDSLTVPTLPFLEIGDNDFIENQCFMEMSDGRGYLPFD